jgi:hypothetical protein
MNTVAVSCFEVMSSDLQKGEVVLSVGYLKMRTTHNSDIHTLTSQLVAVDKFTYEKQKPVCERKSKCRQPKRF